MKSLSRRRAFVAIVLAVFCAAPAVILAYLARSFASSPVPLGHAMPKFSAKMLDGRDFVPDSANGKKHVVVFFAPECGHCRNELCNLDELLPKFKDSIDIIGVSLDNAESTTAMATELHLNFPIIVADNEHLDESYRVKILPGIFCFDEYRTLRKFYLGEHTLVVDELLLEDFISSAGVH